jgi:glutaredoxin
MNGRLQPPSATPGPPGERPSGRVLWILALAILLLVAGQAWWRADQQADVGRALAAAVEPGDLTMLSSDTCPICVRARQWFQAHQVPFDECSIERDTACAARFQALQAPGTPVIVVRGRALLGFDPQRLLAAARERP